MAAWMDSSIFNYVVLPFIIFFNEAYRRNFNDT